MEAGDLEGVVISPGPKNLKDCGNCKEIVEKLAGKVPVLGICQGHQTIGHVFGAEVEKGERPMHGKVTAIQTNQKGCFRTSRGVSGTRYHSLVVSKERFPECLEIDASSHAWSDYGTSSPEISYIRCAVSSRSGTDRIRT